MTKKVYFGFVLIFITAIIILSCSTSRLVREENVILAKVNNQDILLKDLKNKLDELNYYSTSPEEDLEKKGEALDDLITDQLVKQKARTLDLSDDMLFQQEKDKHMKKFLMNMLYRNEINQEIVVTDQEIEEYYREHPYEYYLVPDKARVGRILIKIKGKVNSPDYPRKEQKALDRISIIRQRIINGEDFSELARELSEDSWSAKRSGNLGYVMRRSIIPPFEDFVFFANLNELSQPIRSPEGWNLLIVRERIAGEKSELDERARTKTREYLEKEKQNLRALEYVERLKEKTSFVFNEYALSCPDSLISNNPWVLILNQQDSIWYNWYRYVWEAYKKDIKDDSLLLEYKKDILINSSLVINPLIRQEAREKGYLNLPEYREQEKQFTLTWAEEKIRKELKNEISAYHPDEEEIYDYYLAHRESYPRDSSIHVYHILLEDSLLAEEIREKIIGGAAFEEMAKKYHGGIEIKGNTSYDLGFISDQTMPEEFYKAAVLLQEGQVSQIVRTEYGYHLIKLVERTSSLLNPYKPGIRIKLEKLKAQHLKKEWEEKLREESQIWVNEDLLKNAKLNENQKD